MEWQPIETAPKGVDLLVWTDYKRLVIAMDCSETDKRKFLTQDSQFVGKVSYWMSLPEPPKI